MADAMVDTHIKEDRSGGCKRASSLRMGILSLLCTVAIMIGGLVGTFYVFRLMENRMPYPECKLIKPERWKGSHQTSIIAADPTSSIDSILISASDHSLSGASEASTVTTMALVPKQDINSTISSVSPTGTASYQASVVPGAPVSERLELLSADNLVKLTLQGHVMLHDVAQDERYQLEMGNEGTLVHHLDELVPTIEVKFACGKVTMYVNAADNGTYYVVMMTGELAHGNLNHDQACFSWRTKASGLLFPVHAVHLHSHYYCDQEQQFSATVHGESHAYKLQLTLAWLELELNRKPDSPPERFITKRGLKCEHL